jgi:transposase InsO family protein
LSFLISYFLVIVAATLPYQIVVSIWPKGLQYLLGSEAGNRFGVLLILSACCPSLDNLVVQIFYRNGSAAIEELRQALAEFHERYKQRWIVPRLGYVTHAQTRQQSLALGAAA